MVTFIKIEYIVANAIVELFEKKERRSVSFDEIENYGFKVEEILNKKSKAILLYSSYYTREFLNDYSDFFEENNGEIALKKGKTTEDLRNHILCFVPIEILFAMRNNASLSTILR